MPFVNVTLTQPLGIDKKQQLLQEISEATVHSLATPLASVRVLLHDLPQGHYLCAGQTDVAAVIFEVDMMVGRPEDVRARFIAALSGVAHRVTGVSEDQIRVRITEFPKENFGVAGGLTAKAAGR